MTAVETEERFIIYLLIEFKSGESYCSQEYNGRNTRFFWQMVPRWAPICNGGVALMGWETRSQPCLLMLWRQGQVLFDELEQYWGVNKHIGHSIRPSKVVRKYPTKKSWETGKGGFGVLLLLEFTNFIESISMVNTFCCINF